MKSPECLGKAEALPKDRPRRGTGEETANALNNLTTGEMYRLKVRAKKLTEYGVLQGEHEDIINEAVARTLVRLNWYVETNPTILEHLNWTIRTIASENRQKLLIEDNATGKFVARLFDPQSSGDEKFWENLVAGDAPEEVLANEEIFNLILQYYADDAEAIEVIKCRYLGYNGTETVQVFGLTKKQYQAVDKRIERRWHKLKEKLFPANK